MTVSLAQPLESKRIFSDGELSLIDRDKVPQHIAIIMDGNRRWAKEQGLSPIIGHWEGAETLTEIVRAASELGVKTLTVYAFSTENWHRTPEELEELMNLFYVYLVKKRTLMVQEGIRLHAIGDLSKFPEKVQSAFTESHKATEKGEKINFVLAMNYGSRDELRRAMVQMLREYQKQPFEPESITEEWISKHLDTCSWGDPELVIRTSGEYRVSNFLLWQISYSELYITDVLWPDFHPKQLLQAVIAYQNRVRRIGV